MITRFLVFTILIIKSKPRKSQKVTINVTNSVCSIILVRFVVLSKKIIQLISFSGLGQLDLDRFNNQNLLDWIKDLKNISSSFARSRFLFFPLLPLRFLSKNIFFFGRWVERTSRNGSPSTNDPLPPPLQQYRSTNTTRLHRSFFVPSLGSSCRIRLSSHPVKPSSVSPSRSVAT